MAKPKRKTLPKDFVALLEEGDLAKLKAVLEECEPDARGILDRTALVYACPDELSRWLVERGAGVDTVDRSGNTPLQSRITTFGASIDVLLELGANVHHAGSSLGTPLHTAASSSKVEHVRRLLSAGALVDAPNRQGKTPLEVALERAHNAFLPALLATARTLLEAGAERRASMPAAVRRIGETFEFHRAGFNAELLPEASAALEQLYALFEVPPVARRTMHDGASDIVAKPGDWEAQHAELWKLLVPSSGPATTVQGEVIRIAGRIADEIHRNGGGNWDDAYRAMARAFIGHVESGTPLQAGDVADVRRALRGQPTDDEADELVRLAVRWVRWNPKPVPLAPPSYRR